jgi:hypothetical protein
MTFNVGTPDRIVRVILGLFLIAAPFVTGWALFASLAWTWGALLVGIVLVATGAIRFCPAYRLFNLSTSKNTSQ